MDHDHSITTKRIEAFSDGVFAIVVTLLVLDLRLPEIVNNLTNQAAIGVLIKLLPQFVSFVLSFFIICIFWVNHHQFFTSLKKSDRKFMWLNNVLLFWLCFIPFPTAFLGRFPTNQVAVILFGAILFLAATSFALMTHHAMFKSDLFDEHVTMHNRKRIQRMGYWGISLYAASILLAFVSVYISLAIYIIVPLIYFVPRRIKFS